MENNDNYYKEIFSKNLNYYMLINSKKQDDLIKALDIDKSTISTWCNGTRLPRMDKIEVLANYFNIEKSDLIEPRDNKYKTNKAHTLIVPIFGVIPAGIPMEAIEDILGYEEITISENDDREYFGLKIKGDSMSPEYLENDVIIFIKQNNCENGQKCAVMVNGDDATFKKVIKKENRNIITTY